MTGASLCAASANEPLFRDGLYGSGDVHFEGASGCRVSPSRKCRKKAPLVSRD